MFKIPVTKVRQCNDDVKYSYLENKFSLHSIDLVGKIMWKDGRCYEFITPPEDCKDEYNIKTKSGIETVIIGEEERVEDLLVVDCITYDEKYN